MHINFAALWPHVGVMAPLTQAAWQWKYANCNIGTQDIGLMNHINAYLRIQYNTCYNVLLILLSPQLLTLKFCQVAVLGTRFQTLIMCIYKAVKEAK